MTTATSPRRTGGPDRPSGAAGGSPQKHPLLNRIFGKHPLGLIFSAPYLVFIAIVFAYPLGLAVWIAFHDFYFTAPGVPVDRPFVGFDNFRTALTDPDVWQAFGNVGIFLLINVPLTVVLSLVLANGLNQITRFRTFLRVAYYVPYVTASVAVVGVWLFLFNGNGLVNEILGPLAPSPSWLINSTWAMPTIALFVTWKQLGLYILLYLAALQNVQQELYESASTDGAGKVRQFFSVTVPGVRPATLLVLLLSTVTGANLFTEPYLLTGGGGPNGSSASPVLIMYQRGLEQGNPDVAAAIGVILIVLVLILAYLQNRFAGERN
ncbi:carbohydrate ABC transporter permease [Planctomonas psychrotolerans]|uniref:carbohydrate ABC transporter permease n=1 Tax=Planctomonas psychrotolerans TaxID=2528712 RepID=UPI00123951B1|nr:sugar ABC transporter permease [Planctomonas psychrotolerans]